MKISSISGRTVFEAALIVALIVLLLLYLFPRSSEKESTAVVVYYTPNETYTDGPYPLGSRQTLRSGPEIDGYTFVGWKDEEGNLVSSGDIYINGDSSYSAVYSIALEKDKHIIFLNQEDGVFRPEAPLTRSELAVALYRLMDLNAVGEGTFLDVAEDEDCYKACATLKDLGIFTGNYFHPTDSVSCRELSQTLELLGEQSDRLTDRKDSDELVTRAECAQILCDVLRRYGDKDDNKELVGTFLDVSPNKDYFWAVAEASVSHEFQGEGEEEKWISCDAFPSYEPGFFYVGTRLHYIDEDGNPVINGTAKGLNFNSCGEETSGDAELDAAIDAVLQQNVDVETQTGSEMLKILYDYLVTDDHFHYLVRNYYEVGDTSWVVDEAKAMLKSKKGNCYNFAAVFYELARAIGYDATIYSGTMGSERRPHSWVEIDHGDKILLYDPEYQYANPGTNMYARDESIRDRYKYKTEPVVLEETPEAESTPATAGNDLGE